VVLTTPTGYEWLVHEAWSPVISHAPKDYEVVLGMPPDRTTVGFRPHGPGQESVGDGRITAIYPCK
jgi:hypothetical protein